MGLQSGKDYGAKEIQAAVRSLADRQDIVITIEDFGEGAGTVVFNGTQLTTSAPIGKGGKIKLTKQLQDMIYEALRDDTLTWSGS